MSDFETVLYKDNIGDLYLVPKSYVDHIQSLDDFISHTTGYFDIHNPLVEAWETIMNRYRVDVHPRRS